MLSRIGVLRCLQVKFYSQDPTLRFSKVGSLQYRVFLWVDDPNTLIYCGYALYPKAPEDAEILLKILNSNVFWYYLSNTSKNYAGGYKSFAKNYVKKFSIPHLDKEQKKFLLALPAEKINHYLFDLYGLQDRQLTRSE